MKAIKFLVAIFVILYVGGCNFTVVDTPELRERMGEMVLEAPPLPTEEPCLWVKGNINAAGEKIYHLPGQANYTKVDPEVEFCTEQEAIDAGFRKSKT